LIFLDSRVRGNDEKGSFLTFYEFVKIEVRINPNPLQKPDYLSRIYLGPKTRSSLRAGGGAGSKEMALPDRIDLEYWSIGVLEKP